MLGLVSRGRWRDTTKPKRGRGFYLWFQGDFLIAPTAKLPMMCRRPSGSLTRSKTQPWGGLRMTSPNLNTYRLLPPVFCSPLAPKALRTCCFLSRMLTLVRSLP